MHMLAGAGAPIGIGMAELFAQSAKILGKTFSSVAKAVKTHLLTLVGPWNRGDLSADAFWEFMTVKNWPSTALSVTEQFLWSSVFYFPPVLLAALSWKWLSEESRPIVARQALVYLVSGIFFNIGGFLPEWFEWYKDDRASQDLLGAFLAGLFDSLSRIALLDILDRGQFAFFKTELDDPLTPLGHVLNVPLNILPGFVWQGSASFFADDPKLQGQTGTGAALGFGLLTAWSSAATFMVVDGVIKKFLSKENALLTDTSINQVESNQYRALERGAAVMSNSPEADEVGESTMPWYSRWFCCRRSCSKAPNANPEENF